MCGSYLGVSSLTAMRSAMRGEVSGSHMVVLSWVLGTAAQEWQGFLKKNKKNLKNSCLTNCVVAERMIYRQSQALKWGRVLLWCVVHAYYMCDTQGYTPQALRVPSFSER